MKKLRDMWDFLTKFPDLKAAIEAEFAEHNRTVADLVAQVETADNARKHAQAVSTQLVEYVRALDLQLKGESVQSVTTWANETFGPATIQAQLDRAMKEIVELADTKDPNKIAEEAADVCICLYRVIGTLDAEAINKKMAKNRARIWKLDGNGCAQHVTLAEVGEG